MKLVVQRVSHASVDVDGAVTGSIQKGLLVLFGAKDTDDKGLIDYLVDKLINLRIFHDSEGKMNLSLCDVKGDLLIVSQFTLYGDCSKGRRPSFIKSAKGPLANELYESFIAKAKEELKSHSLKVETGIFGADMKVSLLNDGPVTIILEKSNEPASI
ncbi:MAG: D-aminoacyl-tRNA deacylase [Chlamydiia bacterium]|nr:D-aminoacyl-tRNA deacylase [Chlamydiia bacterium]